MDTHHKNVCHLLNLTAITLHCHQYSYHYSSVLNLQADMLPTEQTLTPLNYITSDWKLL